MKIDQLYYQNAIEMAIQYESKYINILRVLLVMSSAFQVRAIMKNTGEGKAHG